MRALTAIGVIALGACHEGRVRLELSAPAAAELDPQRGAESLTLVALAEGREVYASTIDVPARGEALGFGEVPVRDELWFEVRATAAAGRVVGFGRATEAVDVNDDEEVRVAMELRRPFAYLAGADSLVVVDATREPGEDYVTTMVVGGPVRGVAGSRDGAELVVVTDASVRLVSTSTHAALAGEVPLPSAPFAFAISDDGRWAAVSHRTAPEGLSIIDLQVLRDGAALAPAFVAIERPGAVGIGGGVAWVLKDPLDSFFCGGTSSVVSVPLDAPAAAPPIPLTARAGTLAVDPASGTAIVSVGCASEVVAIDVGGSAPRLVYAAPGVGALTVSGGRLWMTGHVEGPDAHLSIIDMGLDGSDPRTRALPSTEERAIAVALEEAGQDGEIRLTADLHTAFALSVLPDGAHVAILEIAAHIGEAAGDAGGGRPIVPEMQLLTYEYQLVRLDTGLDAQRLRLSCTITWEPGALLDDFRCGRVPGQDDSPVAFPASDLSVLYGSR